MLARSRVLWPGRSLQLTSPLLIPSLSSKGSPLLAGGVSAANDILRLVAPALEDVCLVSAYDLKYRFLPDAEPLVFGQGGAASQIPVPDLVVVDSGGYELSTDFEGGEIHRGPRLVEPFSEQDFLQQVAQIPISRRVMVVSYDGPDVRGISYERQYAAAESLVQSHPQLMVDFLVKPPEVDSHVRPRDFLAAVGDLAGFAAVGFAERELGDSYASRFSAIAEARLGMDERGAQEVPIHIFGSLSPIISPLYFMAGAEVFDGLSWMRYAWHEGRSIHRDELALLRGRLDSPDELTEAERLLGNLQELNAVKIAMIAWSQSDSNFDLLGANSTYLQRAYEDLLSRTGS